MGPDIPLVLGGGITGIIGADGAVEDLLEPLDLLDLLDLLDFFPVFFETLDFAILCFRALKRIEKKRFSCENKKKSATEKSMEKEPRYDLVEKKLSAVAWVDNRWFFAVCVFIVLMNVTAALTSGLLGLSSDAGQWVLLALIIVASGLLTYPYLHYRQSGGFIKRIPPRFDSGKAFFGRVSDKFSNKFSRISDKFGRVKSKILF